MSRSKSESLLGLTESFFHNYLKQTRGASGHTVRAYRDALKLFYLFLADRKRKPVADLALDDIESDALLAFLDHVESHRGNSAVTRNCRLAVTGHDHFGRCSHTISRRVSQIPCSNG